LMANREKNGVFLANDNYQVMEGTLESMRDWENIRWPTGRKMESFWIPGTVNDNYQIGAGTGSANIVYGTDWETEKGFDR
jgi:hypothetical protein